MFQAFLQFISVVWVQPWVLHLKNCLPSENQSSVLAFFSYPLFFNLTWNIQNMFPFFWLFSFVRGFRMTWISKPPACWCQWSGSKGITLVNTVLRLDGRHGGLTGKKIGVIQKGGKKQKKRQQTTDVCWWPCMWQCTDVIWDRASSRAWTGCPG